MTRKECLDAAAKAVLTDRSKQYGSPEDCFSLIANLWSSYLGHPVSSCDVACMMALLKIARVKYNPRHADSWVDIAGYAACGAECAAAMCGCERVGGVPYGVPDMAPEETPSTGNSFHGVPLKTM